MNLNFKVVWVEFGLKIMGEGFCDSRVRVGIVNFCYEG